ncbi:GNAT family N-acetyltransferase [Lentzea sp. NPDC051213]|uniref:GNAT family N-acetyltransferase n=1 Tax=Lentzea sp. NPDC051213 TaxID=3364126 RepID=UPI00379661A5
MTSHAEVVSSDVSRAERALHRRAAWACSAAVEAGVPGNFRAWEQAGVLAVLATDPALSFLSTVSGVTAETVRAAIDLANMPIWGDVRPTVVVPASLSEAAMRPLRAAGLAQAEDRLLAVKRLEASPVVPGLTIVDADSDGRFVDTLLAGYEVDGAVAAFIRAEHQLPMMHRFLAVQRGTPFGAAAMTIHDDVAVLGGASTLRAHRGRGAQSGLLHHRLRAAAEAGCVLAVATARPGSVSASNLRRAGFLLEPRVVWR